MTLKALIAEDVQIVRDTLVRLIDWPALGLELTGAAEDGEQALELAERKAPDLLVTDIGMPFMDGIALIRRVRERFPTMKAIILTGLSEFQYAQEAVKLGVFDYVLKPIDPVALSRAIEVAVAAIREERNNREEVEKAKELLKEKLPHVAGELATAGGMSVGLKNVKIVERIVAYIQANVTSRSLSLPQIAAQVNLSEKYASAIFKETVGTTINSYIIACKMERAAQLLQEPSVKVYEVCDLIGYADQDYFRASFKKYHGFTPSEYRNRHL